MHFVSTDTLTLGISWLNKQIYGEGGLQIHLGYYILCFWKRPKPFCIHGLNDCFICSAEYTK